MSESPPRHRPPAARGAWLPHPLLTVVLVLVWLLLQNSFSLAHLALGLVLGMLIPRLTSGLWPARPRIRRYGKVVAYFFLVVGDIVRANIDVARLILFCDVERPMTNGVVARLNHVLANTLIRASKTQNVEGEPVGVLNRVFGYAYRVRLVGKWLKARSTFAYYALKYALIGGLLYWIFLS